MVKSGEQRALKFKEKNDPYVIMLRNKHFRFHMIQKFKDLTFFQYSIDEIIKKVASKYSLAWGTVGRYHDLTMRLFWKNEYDPQEWEDQGIPPDAYDDTIVLIEQLGSFFYSCVYPKSKQLTVLSVDLAAEKMPLSDLFDWLNNVSVTSEQQIPVASPVENPATNLETLVCVLNTCGVINLLLPSPVIETVTLSILAPISFPSVANLFAQNSTPEIDIDSDYTILPYSGAGDLEDWEVFTGTPNDNITDTWVGWTSAPVDSGIDDAVTGAYSGTYCINLRPSGAAPLTSYGKIYTTSLQIIRDTIKFYLKKPYGSTSTWAKFQLLNNDGSVHAEWTLTANTAWVEIVIDVSAHKNDNLKFCLEAGSNSAGYGYSTLFDYFRHI
jgi:hypothetical protein